MNDLTKFVMAVEFMRNCQKNYQKRFTDKAKSELIAAERNVDKMIKEFKEEREVKVGTQNELFG